MNTAVNMCRMHQFLRQICAKRQTVQRRWKCCLMILICPMEMLSHDSYLSGRYDIGCWEQRQRCRLFFLCSTFEVCDVNQTTESAMKVLRYDPGVKCL